MEIHIASGGYQYVDHNLVLCHNDVILERCRRLCLSSILECDIPISTLPSALITRRNSILFDFFSIFIKCVKMYRRYWTKWSAFSTTHNEAMEETDKLNFDAYILLFGDGGLWWQILSTFVHDTFSATRNDFLLLLKHKFQNC